MCPEVRETKPGACPSCGMALEAGCSRRLHAHRVHLPHASRNRPARARSMSDLRHGARAPHGHRRRRRKSRTPRHDPPLLGQPRAHRCRLLRLRMERCSGIGFTIDLQPGRRADSILPWLELVLATPVVLWGGWPFFQRFWTSLVNRSPNMFTLIGMGTGVAYGYSVIATLAPQIFPESLRGMGGYPDVYFEAAAAITTLVLLGQVMELRARSRTSAAIRALLDLSPQHRASAQPRRHREGYSARAGATRRPSARASRRKNPGRRRAPRRPQLHRRIHDHRRIHARREIAGQQSHRRHHQRHRLVRHARRARGQRNFAGAHRATRRPGAAQPRSHPATRRSRSEMVRPHRRRGRGDHFCRVVAVRSAATLRARTGQRGRRAHHRLPLRAWASPRPWRSWSA